NAVPELLQAPRCADEGRELRCPQRFADPDSGARRDGAGVVPGWNLGVRLDRSKTPEGNCILRSWSGGLNQNGDGWIVVGVLVQRQHRKLGNRPWSGHLRAASESVHLGERN